MLLMGAGLLIRSFVRLQDVPLDSPPNTCSRCKWMPATAKYHDGKVTSRFYRDIKAVSHICPE